MKKLDVRLLRLIKHSKGQFFSISIMVIIALTIYVSFNMVSDNLYNSIYHYYEVTNFGDIFIEVVRVPKTAIDHLYTIEGIESVQGRISADVPLRVEDPKEKVRVRIVSMPNEEKKINNLYIAEGKELQNNAKKAAVLQQFSDARGIKVGDKVRPYISGREYPLDVISIVGSPEYIYLMENEQTLLPAPEQFGILYVTEDFAQTTLGYQGSYNEIMIKINPEYAKRVDGIVDEIEDQLDRYGVKRIVKRENQLSHSMMMQEVAQLETMATSITLLFLIVAAIIINIMLSRIVKNDRMSIGVMKALGYNNLSILMHYTKFSLVIGLLGSMIGMVLSIPMSAAFTNLYIMYMNIPMFEMALYEKYFVYGILLTSVFCIASGLIGARSVLKILPASAMQPEAPKVGHRIWLEKIKFIWNRISFSWKMVIRNILRKKKRAIFLILGIALTYSITMVPIFMSTVWTNIFLLQYGEYQTMGYNIDFSGPMDDSVIREVRQLIDVDTIEPKTEIPFELVNGWKKKAVSIIALPENTNFYHFENMSGEKIFLPRDGVLLADRLATTLGVEVGDDILMKSFLPNGEDTYINVKGIVKQYLGTNAYMTIDTMNTHIGEKGLITGVLLDSEDEVVTKLKDVKNIKQVQSIEDMKNSFLEFMDTMIYSVGVMMIFGGILGFAIVYNVNVISISERVMEFSSLRVLGFDKKEIYKMVSRENGLMAFFGILIGMPLGYSMCKGMISSLAMEMVTIPLIIENSSYVVTAIATLSFVVIAQLATIRKIYRLNFLDALKNRIS
ncbi:MAG: peptide ABC transporter permease [Firmicutes bacterium HGW-Firmicutes-1]|nr:MAG: peptide ABC transporter permease [Firmicutes bacterium HGW-Firmicutes-1]